MEGSVEQTVTPLNANHRRRVSAVKGILVVEGLTPRHGLFHVDGPTGQGLAPGHADVVVQFAMTKQRALTGRPQGIVNLGSFELTHGIEGGAWVVLGRAP